MKQTEKKETKLWKIVAKHYLFSFAGAAILQLIFVLFLLLVGISFVFLESITGQIQFGKLIKLWCWEE